MYRGRVCKKEAREHEQAESTTLAITPVVLRLRGRCALVCAGLRPSELNQKLFGLKEKENENERHLSEI